MKLDIGCGHNPQGDVNIDLFVRATAHRSSDQRLVNDTPLNTRNIPNFIVADACNLPFRNEIFDEVFSSHTIEHVAKPFEMLKEMVRVSKSLVTIRCPHRFSDCKSKKIKVLHINQFNLTYFIQTFEKLGMKNVYQNYSNWRCFPHPFICIVRLPAEITVQAKRTHLIERKQNEMS